MILEPSAFIFLERSHFFGRNGSEMATGGGCGGVRGWRPQQWSSLRFTESKGPSTPIWGSPIKQVTVTPQALFHIVSAHQAFQVIQSSFPTRPLVPRPVCFDLLCSGSECAEEI